jgi:hypothetical protein
MSSNDQPWKYLFNNLTTQQLIKSAPGTLHNITIGTAGAAGTMTIVDGLTATTGTTIASVPTTSVTSFLFDVGFGTGLTIQCVSAAAFTVSFI